MAKTPDLYTLKNRTEYLGVAATGFKKPMPGLVLQGKPAETAKTTGTTGTKGDNKIWVGITATKRTGGAVERNRIKRRLRQVIKEVLPSHGRAGYQYVVIGRKNTLKRPYDLLREDLKTALAVLHKRITPET